MTGWGSETLRTRAHARERGLPKKPKAGCGSSPRPYCIAAASAKLRVRFKEVKVSSGTVVRAEPVAALYEQDRLHHVGAFPALEDQMIAFTTLGYMGDGSPDRAGALIWGLTELFPRVVSASSSSDLKDTRHPYGRDRPDNYPTGRSASSFSVKTPSSRVIRARSFIFLGMAIVYLHGHYSPKSGLRGVSFSHFS